MLNAKQIRDYAEYARNVVRKTLDLSSDALVDQELMAVKVGPQWRDSKLAEYIGRLEILEAFELFFEKKYSNERKCKALAKLYGIQEYTDLRDVLIRIAANCYIESKMALPDNPYIQGRLQAVLWMLNGCIFHNDIDVIFKVDFPDFKAFYKCGNLINKEIKNGLHSTISCIS